MTGLTDPAFSAPTCPDCGVVLHDDAAGLRCPECGITITAENTPTPPPFTGPDLDDWR